MKLLTKEIEKKFERHPIGSQEGKMDQAVVLVKYFNPIGAGTWLITEAEKQEDGDWMLFGYCHILSGNGDMSCCPNFSGSGFRLD